ncbi:MAG TPA: hypothetical protein VHQ44_09985 [Thermoanaerobaculia bacterium]|nr:hypothetical protein [Thermoanaerobaculia bacterium]
MKLRVHGTPVGRRVLGGAALLVALAAIPVPAAAQTGTSPTRPATRSETPFVVEYYYKAKWGFADEFARLFKKNHLPVLKKQIESGRFLEVRAEKPRYHATEDGRWDYRVTIVFKSAAVAADSSGEDEIKKQLFPDQETYRREEQRRFEILLAHWDLPLVAAPEMAP